MNVVFRQSRIGHPPILDENPAFRIPHAQWCENMADEVNSNAQQRDDAAAEPDALQAIARAARSNHGGLPPVHLWNPPHCGDIGLKISRDGSWSYQGSPIGRPALVRLFSTVLRRDGDEYVLVTPVERVSVEVEDAPFLAVGMEKAQGPAGPTLRFRTNVEDVVEAGPGHELRFENGAASGIKPYLHVRSGLWALVTRALAYDLVELAEIRDVGGRPCLGVESGGQFFVMEAYDQEPEQLD